jgi:Transglutaminase-like superfamily
MRSHTRTVEPSSYLDPGPLTALTTEQQHLVHDLPAEPIELCKAAQRLLVLPPSASGDALSPRRLAERNLRPASAIVDAVLARDTRPLNRERALEDRVTGTCRHFAVVSCSFLRARRIAARARCGFATYFEPGLAVDHWVTEYWDDNDRRWVRIDSEVLDLEVIPNPHDLDHGQFLTGPEAWGRYRSGTDARTFGVHGTDNWGVAEIIGNAIRDLANLNRVEMLPWDEWGPMRDCYDGNIEAWVEECMDDLVAATTGDGDVAALYDRVPVPEALVG